MRVNLFGREVNISGGGSLRQIHFVPWKTKLVMEAGRNGKMTPVEEPMTWVDAAKVAAILCLVEFFGDYSMQHPFPYPGCTDIVLQAWLIQGAFFLLRKFTLLFATLTGLTLLGSAAVKKTKKKEE
jgi:hypothetical protein